MADQKLSALTELAATPATDDEVYIRDVSEPSADESKRITIANLLADKSKIIWKDVSEQALADLNRTSNLAYTDLDLTAYTSANAKFAILVLGIVIDSISTGSARLRARKNGTTPTYVSETRVANTTGDIAGGWRQVTIIVALDAGQVLEYEFELTGTIQVDSYIYVLGYIE